MKPIAARLFRAAGGDSDIRCKPQSGRVNPVAQTIGMAPAPSHRQWRQDALPVRAEQAAMMTQPGAATQGGVAIGSAKVRARLRGWRLCALLLGGTIASLGSIDLYAAPGGRAELGALCNPLAPDTVDSDPNLANAVREYYRARACTPVWTDPGRQQQLLNQIAGMAEDGLDPEHYGWSALRSAWTGTGSAPTRPDAMAAEIGATRALFKALSHLLNGKVDPRALDPNWNFARRPLNLHLALFAAATAIESAQLDRLFERARPRYPLYRQLRTGLRQLRQVEGAGGWPSLPDGPTLKPGMSDARVPALRTRLAQAGYLSEGGTEADRNATFFDSELEAALRQFQQEQLLQADGAVGTATRAALNLPVAQRIDQLRANLERARWLLHEPSADFLLVDIAGYRASYYQDGKVVWRTRVQVGKPYRKTPSFRAQIDHITINPTWTVPPTILRNDVLPKIRKDPGYLKANRLRVLDAAGKTLSPDSIDWQQPGPIHIRQDAGPGNSLGRVAIRFNNPYSIYLHDTPHTELFARDQRAFSSGCIRVEQPLELVERLLADPEHWDRAQIDAAIASGQTRNVRLARPLTLLLVYWSVDVHDGGRLSFKPDVYRRDARLLALLDRPD